MPDVPSGEERLRETEISDETVYEGHLITVHRKRVRLPDGREGLRELVLHPGAVAMVPLTSDHQVILVRQFRKAAERILLEIPAGTLTPGENVEAAAVRELREEIGCRPGKLERLGGIFVAPGYSTEYIHLFLAQGLSRDPLYPDHDEFIERVTLPFETALSKVLSGEIEDAKSISGLLLAAKRLSK
jgi:ADP-ribose pyrophosphatase